MVFYNYKLILKFFFFSLILIFLFLTSIEIQALSILSQSDIYDRLQVSIADFESRYGYDVNEYVVLDNPQNSRIEIYLRSDEYTTSRFFIDFNDGVYSLYARRVAVYNFNYDGGVNNYTTSNIFGYYNAFSQGLASNVLYNSNNLYYENMTDIYFPANPVSDTFTAPYVALPDDSTDKYISGQFADFVVVGGTDVTNLYFSFNDGSAEEYETKYVYLPLNNESPYYINNFENDNIYIIPKTILPGGYLDGHIYNLSLDYEYNNTHYSTTVITWTTNFSDQAILNDELRTQDQINQGVQDINNFLNDDTFDGSSIISNMPSNDMQDPTADAINNIFNMFRNVFSTENARDVVFNIPNTDEAITIPANLVISHIPQPLLILIQSFYWFLICRFIVKDISKIVEHAKSGEILDVNDGNIKTDLL